MVKHNQKINLMIIVFFQIILILNMTFAESYFLHQTDQITKNIISDKNDNLSDLISKFLIDFLIIKQIGTVSAVGWSCCPETIIGAKCQELASVDTESCAVEMIPSKCEEFSDCQLGCCVDEIEGLCSTKTPKSICKRDNGTWSEDENCLIQECQKGCCMLGEEASFVTETRCEQLSSIAGTQKDFRDINNEVDCLMQKVSSKLGACVLDFEPIMNRTNKTNSSITGAIISNSTNNRTSTNFTDDETCRIVTESECYEMGGTFAGGYLCSHPDLNTGCKRQTTINCVDSSDEIFWFDSCGNKENIYSSDRDASWNGGMMMSKEKSCNPDVSNANSKDCGNCNYFLGSICQESKNPKVKDGNFICKDMDCIDEDGTKRKNGESWCIYDSYIGDGKDTVGSRHWKRMCIDGEIKVEPCADYRGEICVQAKNKEGESFSYAACVVNEALACILEYNSLETEEERDAKCLENKDCMIKEVKVSKDFTYDICTSRYPKGFDLAETEKGKTQERLCDIGSQNCTVLLKKGWFKSDYTCEKNCECKTKLFTQQLNDVCISLGDCGSYINFVGDGSDNIIVKNTEKISWRDYIGFAEPVKGQFAEPKKNRGPMGGESNGTDRKSNVKGDDLSGLDMLGTIAGGLGTLVGGAQYLYGGEVLYASGYGFFAAEGASAGVGVTPVFASFGAAAAGFAIGSIIGSYWAKSIGATKETAMIMAISGGVAGAAIGYALVQASISTFNIYVIVIAIIIMIIAALFGPRYKTEKVTFKCQQWAAPTGGENCEKCNEDLLKPCSAYRCSSLGQACQLMENDTKNPICIGSDDDGKPPIIFPLNTSDGYKFFEKTNEGVKIRTDNQKCIPEFTMFDFSLGTDELAQCKYSFEKTKDYEEMTETFLESNSYSMNHSTSFMMPSIQSLENDINETEITVIQDLKETYAKLNLYVRCQDVYGNKNVREYIVNLCINDGPDLTAPYIKQMDPKDGKGIKFNSTQTQVTAYVNEPADCKYDTIPKKAYEQMNNSMQCNTQLDGSGLYGWPCQATFSNLKPGANKFYLKCKDQPWLNESNTSRNANTEDYIYTLNVAEKKFNISSISPQGIIKNGFAPSQVNLEVQTIGGVENGKGTCEYSFTQNGEYYQFFSTFSTKHKQTFELMGGNYTIYVKCEDETNDQDSRMSQFDLQIDSTPPVVINYTEGEKIEFYTDEDAECYYHPSKCNFDFENGTLISTQFTTEHQITFDPSITYHIKCTDVWKNTNPDCAIILNAPDLDLPMIVRAYNSNSELKIMTDKISKCYYDFETCLFNPTNAPSMTTDLTKEHTVNWIPGKVYHIKCADAWGNFPIDCTRKISM